jgi:hypothetical protein
MRGEWWVAWLTALAVFAPSLAGEINEKALLRQLEFLQDGKTERAEVVARLGMPEATFANDTVASYSAQLLAADNRLFVCPCRPQLDIKAKFRLTLQFSADGILRQHALVNRD